MTLPCPWVVDVLAISGLNQIVRNEDEQRQEMRRDNNRKAQEFLLSFRAAELPGKIIDQGDQAQRLLWASGGVDPQFSDQLNKIAERAMPYRLVPAPPSWRKYGVPGARRRPRTQQAPRIDLGELGREDE
jgi:hypothetical protein